MERMIDIKIERHVENGEIYYLATSDDVQGLIAQGSTVEETLAIAKELVYELIEVRKEIDSENFRHSNNVRLADIPNSFHQHLFIEA